jgi:hypothetical protein
MDNGGSCGAGSPTVGTAGNTEMSGEVDIFDVVDIVDVVGVAEMVDDAVVGGMGMPSDGGDMDILDVGDDISVKTGTPLADMDVIAMADGADTVGKIGASRNMNDVDTLVKT